MASCIKGVVTGTPRNNWELGMRVREVKGLRQRGVGDVAHQPALSGVKMADKCKILYEVGPRLAFQQRVSGVGLCTSNLLRSPFVLLPGRGLAGPLANCRSPSILASLADQLSSGANLEDETAAVRCWDGSIIRSTMKYFEIERVQGNRVKSTRVSIQCHVRAPWLVPCGAAPPIASTRGTTAYVQRARERANAGKIPVPISLRRRRSAGTSRSSRLHSNCNLIPNCPIPLSWHIPRLTSSY